MVVDFIEMDTLAKTRDDPKQVLCHYCNSVLITIYMLAFWIQWNHRNMRIF